MKRKILVMAMVVVCLAMLLSFTALANDISVYVDNEYVRLTDVNGTPVYPFIQNGTTYVPLRGVSQALDCQVGWDGNNKNVLIYKDIQPDGSVFRNRSEDIQVYVDNEIVELKDANGTVVKPILKNGTTYVPIRGVSKALGYPINWNGETRSVCLWKDLVPPEGVTIDFLRPYEVDAPIGGMDILYESDGKTVKIDNIDYTNTIWGIFGSAYFNLDGKYDRVTCVLLPESENDMETTITFFVDGKIVETFVVDPDSFAEKINVDLNKGLQLKIVFNAGKTLGCDSGLGNITFYGE